MLPKDFTSSMWKLHTISLIDYNLIDNIPKFLGLMKSFHVFMMFNNYLSSIIPTTFIGSNIIKLWIKNNNKLLGTIDMITTMTGL
jgi:hypothetical protein